MCWARPHTCIRGLPSKVVPACQTNFQPCRVFPVKLLHALALTACLTAQQEGPARVISACTRHIERLAEPTEAMCVPQRFASSCPYAHAPAWTERTCTVCLGALCTLPPPRVQAWPACVCVRAWPMPKLALAEQRGTRMLTACKAASRGSCASAHRYMRGQYMSSCAAKYAEAEQDAEGIMCAGPRRRPLLAAHAQRQQPLGPQTQRRPLPRPLLWFLRLHE